MRGINFNIDKVADFLSNYPSDISLSDLSLSIRKEILEIDKKLFQITSLKKKKTKLNNILLWIDKTTKSKEIIDKDNVKFLNLQNIKDCRNFCLNLKDFADIKNIDFNNNIKQMLMAEIIIIVDNKIIIGKNYSKFMDFSK